MSGRCSMQRAAVLLLVIGISLIIVTAISYPVINVLVQKNVKKQTLLVNGSQLFKEWLQPTVPIYLQIYLFDFENPDDFLQGSKPSLKQRGPYTYREYWQKVDIVKHTNSTISYRQIKTYQFDRNMSVGNDDDIITTVNIPLMALIQYYKGLQSKIIKDIVKFSAIFEDVVIRKSVNEILWGYQDPLLAVLHKYDPNLVPSPMVGVFVGKNGSNDGVYTIFTGEDHYEDLGIIDKYNGQRNLSFWTSNYANMINGSDGTVFSPKVLSKTKPLYMLVTDLCRSIYTNFVSTATVQGIHVYQYTATAHVLSNATLNPDNAGFCTPHDKCLDTGVINLTSCQAVGGLNIPIIASLPHFHQAAEQYQQAFNGLEPNLPDLATELDIEPITGLIMKANKRIQVNIWMEHNDLKPSMETIKDYIFPVLWINESSTIDEEQAHQLKSQLLIPVSAFAIIQFVLFGIATFLIISTIVLCVLWVKTDHHTQFERINDGSLNDTEPVHQSDQSAGVEVSP